MQCTRCGFDNPPGFAFCGRCGAPLSAPPPPDQLTQTDLDDLNNYLPRPLIESLRFDLAAPPPRLLEECLAQLTRLLDVTYRHLPAYVAEQVTRDPTPGRAAGQFIHGTLLFADISGFTAMSERLGRAGQEGAEEVTGVINRYFDTMLSLLRQHGGQLIKFGGDALLGLFPEEAGRSAARAAHAALEMQAAMDGFAQTRLINNAWTADDFNNAVFSPVRPIGFGLMSLNSHFDHFRFFPNDANDVFAMQITATTDYSGTLAFSVGCHSGLAMPDAENLLTPTDWAQSFARQRAAFIGNTGYGRSATTTRKCWAR
jgi:hypothetical protein